jgi:desulfoferrodoxin (superoxide reductase-like protein)
LQRRLNHGVKGNVSAVGHLGCSIEFFIQYIESQFAPGMAWDGEWHLDHKRPLVSFNLLDQAQAQAAVHYTNIQPLWATDNLKKGA